MKKFEEGFWESPWYDIFGTNSRCLHLSLTRDLSRLKPLFRPFILACVSGHADPCINVGPR